MTSSIISFDQYADRIGKAMGNLAQSMAEAGRLIVETIEHFPDAAALLRKRFPQVPPRMWSMLEKVGRGVMDGRLALGCQHSFQLQRLPLSEQRRALDDVLDLALPEGDTCKVKMQDATPGQARQLIGESSIRTIEQQAAWMRAQVAPAPKSARAALTYEPRPKKGEVEFIACGPGSLVLTKGDLLDILRRLG